MEFDPYKELGLNPDAGPEVVRAAYRALARKHHPDNGAEPDAERMVRINRAYEILSDPSLRNAWGTAAWRRKAAGPKAESQTGTGSGDRAQTEARARAAANARAEARAQSDASRRAQAKPGQAGRQDPRSARAQQTGAQRPRDRARSRQGRCRAEIGLGGELTGCLKYCASMVVGFAMIAVVAVLVWAMIGVAVEIGQWIWHVVAMIEAN